ncbi:MAG: hypothetical protein DRG20_05095 [Deltaproteobacteria bacterium]|nr:tripartite tricarboxylate transporter TctB family protein [Deltaproteobacteria bacterium]RLA89160.1 MAG: hypothetical protein DRG20_05095 [Deltaproteobacteria bacterium]
MKLKADRIFAIILILVAIVFWTQTKELQYKCYIFPRLILIMLIILSAVMFVQSFFKKSMPKGKLPKDNLKYIVISIIIVFVWIALINVLGFITSGVIFLSSLTFLLDLQRLTIKKVVSTILIYILVLIAFWIAFHKFLLVPLPTGHFI